jgi:two-component system cell cycle sensor histidine kinase/response regulator CckA
MDNGSGSSSLPNAAGVGGVPAAAGVAENPPPVQILAAPVSEAADEGKGEAGRRREAAWRECEVGLEQVQRVARIAFCRLDLPAGNWSGTAMLDELLGITPDHPRTFESWLQLVVPEDRAALELYLREHVLAARQPLDREFRIIRPVDRSLRWMHCRGEVEWNADRQPCRLVGTMQDITDRCLAREARWEADELFRTVAETLPGGVSLVRPDGRFRFVSPRLQSMLGVAPEEDLGECGLLDFVSPPERELARASLARVLREWTVVLHEYRLRRKEGAEFIGEMSLAPLAGPGGATVGVLTVVRDVTERRKTEETARRMQIAVDLARDDVIWVNREGRLTYANSAACATLGYTREELCRLSVADINPEFSQRDWAAHWAWVRGRGAVTLESVHRARDGRIVPVELAINFLHFDGQEVHCVFARNLTERRRAEMERLEIERRLLHTQKLESLGVLAGGIAHDFNNLLMGILGNLDLALQDLPAGQRARTSIEQGIQAVNRAAVLTRQILAYSGRGTFVVEEVDLAALVRENEHLLRAGVSKLIPLHLAPGAALPRVIADPGQVQQLVLNLVTNAAEAIGDRAGEVRLSFWAQDFEAEALAGSRCAPVPPPGRFVVLEVRDNGCGMDAATQDRLFEPYVSTKMTGRGLGLSAVLGIVRGHHGAIFVESAVGLGTRMRVLFPAKPVESRAVPGDGAAPPAALAPTGGSCPQMSSKGTVLIVDDETVIRRVCRSMLARNGWNVLEAADGASAIELFGQRAGEIRGVLLDLAMPRMGGAEVFRALRRVSPEVRIVVISGANPGPQFIDELKGEGLAGFLPKPFTSEALLREVVRVFG